MRSYKIVASVRPRDKADLPLGDETHAILLAGTTFSSDVEAISSKPDSTGQYVTFVKYDNWWLPKVYNSKVYVVEDTAVPPTADPRKVVEITVRYDDGILDNFIPKP